MCAIEAQLENMLGTFHCKMKGEDTHICLQFTLIRSSHCNITLKISELRELCREFQNVAALPIFFAKLKTLQS